ncbi:MAG: hypothetical protein NTY46_16770 [Candidatus Sumerlaeota bacterium]|nr:hypothetical protein [Candidatus Sumerlaeota bacterium]
MASSAWKKAYDKNTVACYLDPAEVHSLLKNDLVVGAGEAAVVIKDGKAGEIITEERQRLGDWSDFFKRLLTSMGIGRGPTDYRVLMCCTTPFETAFSLELITLDQQIIPGDAQMRFTVVAEDVSKIAALLGADSSLATYDIVKRVRHELMARVFQPLVGAARHDELRGNLAFIQDLENRAREVLREILAGWGIRLDSITVIWGLTDEEKTAIVRKAKQIKDEELEFEHTRALRDTERRHDIVLRAQELAHEERKQAASGSFELAGMARDAQMTAEQMQKAQHLKLAEINNEIAQLGIDLKLAELQIDREKHRIELDKKKDELTLVKDKELFEHEQDRLDFMMVQEQKRERIRQEQEHDLARLRAQEEQQRQQNDMMIQQMAVQVGMMERVMAQAITTGVANAEVLQTMLKEQTKLSAVNRGAEVAGSVYAAEAAASNMDTYKQAQQDERQHQYQSTELATNMMQASKQQIPPAQMPGFGGYATPIGGQPSVHVVNVQPGAASQPGGLDAKCPHCGEAIKKSWALCPKCGKSAGNPGA